MAYSVHYGVLRTGGDISTLPVTSCTFGDELRGVGSFSAAVGQGQCRGDALWNATRGGYTFWAVEWASDFGRRIVAGGPIFTRTGDDDGITYGGSNMFGMLSHRRLLDQSWPDNQITTHALAYYNLDLGSIMRAIVAQVCTVSPANLPIVLEASRAGTNTRLYLGYDVADAATRISELGGVEEGTAGLGGPDWLFAPQFKGGSTSTVDFTHIEWLFTTGSAANPSLPRIPRDAVVLDRGAPQQQNVGPVSVAEDASNLATHAYNTGGGAEASKFIGSSVDTVLTNAGYPRLDIADTSNATDYPTVKAYSAGLLTRHKRTPSGTTVTVRAAWWWAQNADVGATVRLIDPHHPVFGAVDLTSRVIRWSADVASEWVTLLLADSLTEV